MRCVPIEIISKRLCASHLTWSTTDAMQMDYTNSRAPSNLDGALDSELRNKKAQKGLFVHICSDSAVTIAAEQGESLGESLCHGCRREKDYRRRRFYSRIQVFSRNLSNGVSSSYRYILTKIFKPLFRCSFLVKFRIQTWTLSIWSKILSAANLLNW